MERLIRKENLEFYFQRIDRGEGDSYLQLTITGDYVDSSRKSPLYVNESRMSRAIERLWKEIKTKKLRSISLSFGEIDWYTDETNCYEVPAFMIKRGLKKVRTDHRDHWSIPKDWTADLVFTFNETKAITPITEVIARTLGYDFTKELEKNLTKAFRPVLQGKKKYNNYYNSADYR